MKVAKKKVATPLDEPSKRTRTLSPEARENRCISLAIDMAEEQLANGTASSQVLCHYLKLGTEKAKLENEILQKQKDLLDAKTVAYKSAEKIEKIYEEAIKAMKTYSGQGTTDEEELHGTPDDSEFRR